MQDLKLKYLPFYKTYRNKETPDFFESFLFLFTNNSLLYNYHGIVAQ